ncbi:MAG: glycosyltransferase family 2 protein [Cyanobacteria bacterium TGS_CYA1]|nr:glycosyltransferase family 2 protein [Cyanobacteria bacterium TGS_CYA1]
MTPLVSIVIVNWKTPDLLMACIESIKTNDTGYKDFEFLIVDNNSQDGSVELISKNYPEIFLLANDENLGFSIACNQVIPRAKGKYVLLLNPDTLVEDNAISKLRAFLDERSECGAVGPKVLNPDGTLQLACRRSFPSLESAFYRVTYLSRIFPNNKTFSKYNLTHADPDKELEVDALSGSCMMVRKDIVDRIGLLDEDIFMFGEDIDWCWRVKEDGYKVIYFPQSVVYHIHGASSRLRPIGATINLHKGMEVFYRKHYAKQYWAPINLLVYAAIWARAGLFILVNQFKSFTDNKKKEAIDKQIALSSPKTNKSEETKKSEETEKFETPVK